MDLPVWIEAPAFGLAAVTDLAVGLRYLSWGYGIRAGRQLILPGGKVVLWWSLVFVPFYLTLPVLWIEKPFSAIALVLTMVFAYYFLPYLRGFRETGFLLAYNFDAGVARQQVESALSELHRDFKAEGHRFVSGGVEVMRGIFEPERAHFWIASPPLSKEGRRFLKRMKTELLSVPYKKGRGSPWIGSGIAFTAFGLAFGLFFAAKAADTFDLFSAGARLPGFRLALAAHEGDVEAVEKFIEQGADPDSLDGGGRRPLHFAASGGHVRVAELLIEAGADVRAADPEGRTPLHMAVICKNVALAELLLRSGADPNASDAEGFTPEEIARSLGDEAVARLFERAGSRRDKGKE